MAIARIVRVRQYGFVNISLRSCQSSCLFYRVFILKKNVGEKCVLPGVVSNFVVFGRVVVYRMMFNIVVYGSLVVCRMTFHIVVFYSRVICRMVLCIVVFGGLLLFKIIGVLHREV